MLSGGSTGSGMCLSCGLAHIQDVARVCPSLAKILEPAACGVQGLGEIYEADFVQARAAVTGTALEDREERVRAEARALARELFARLDALSHFQYAPKPVIEDLAVRADVPALAMEEVAPQVRAKLYNSPPRHVPTCLLWRWRRSRRRCALDCMVPRRAKCWASSRDLAEAGASRFRCLSMRHGRGLLTQRKCVQIGTFVLL